MKKIFKTILLISLVSILFSSQFVFAEEPSALETDLQTSMSLIRQNAPDEYLSFYQKMSETYSGEDLNQFKTLHLKYLYLTGNEAEFLKILSEFPKNYTFDNYLKVKGKKLDYISMLKHQKKIKPSDLVTMWKNINEIDRKVAQLIKKDDYDSLIDMVGMQNESSLLNRGTYGGFEKIWARTIDYDNPCERQDIKYDFLIKKEQSITEYLLHNFKNHDKHINLLKLLSKDIGLSGIPKYSFYSEDQSVSEAELKSFQDTVLLFQKERLSLNDIDYIIESIFPGEDLKKRVSYSYDRNSINSIFSLDKEKIDKFKQNEYSLSFIDLKQKDAIYSSVPGSVLFLSKNYAALYLGYSNGTPPSYSFLVFKKEKNVWKPVIRKDWLERGGC